MSVKLHEAYCLDSQQEQLLWWDDFLGDQLKDEWRFTGTGSHAVVDGETGGIVRLTTGAVGDNAFSIDWNDVRSLLVTKQISMETRLKQNEATYLLLRVQLYYNWQHRIEFMGSSTGNYQIKCVNGGSETNLDSGIGQDTSYHIFRMKCHIHGGNHVHFYFDGVECDNSPIATNIPLLYLQPRIIVVTKEASAKSVDIDYVVVRQNI